MTEVGAWAVKGDLLAEAPLLCLLKIALDFSQVSSFRAQSWLTSLCCENTFKLAHRTQTIMVESLGMTGFSASCPCLSYAQFFVSKLLSVETTTKFPSLTFQTGAFQTQAPDLRTPDADICRKGLWSLCTSTLNLEVSHQIDSHGLGTSSHGCWEVLLLWHGRGEALACTKSSINGSRKEKGKQTKNQSISKTKSRLSSFSFKRHFSGCFSFRRTT